MKNKFGIIFIGMSLVLSSISNVFAEANSEPIPQTEPAIEEKSASDSKVTVAANDEIAFENGSNPVDISEESQSLLLENRLEIEKGNDPSGILGMDYLLPDGSIAPMGSVFNFYSIAEMARTNGDCAYVGADNTLTCYWDTPLQKAVDMAAENSTINIMGSFSEQVIIEKPLTLLGAPGAKISAPVSKLDGFLHDEGWISGIDYPVLWVKNTSGVIIQGIELIGLAMDNWDAIGYGNQLLGIGIENSDNVNVLNNKISNFITPKSNLYFGVGIGVFASSNVTIEHNIIEQTNNAIEVEHSTNVVIKDNQLDKSSYGAIDRGTSKVGKNDGLYITYNQISNTPRSFIGCSGCSYVVQNYVAKNNYGLERNAQYIDSKGDNDNDGFWPIDNCVLVYNPDQADFDLDGSGDVCDPTPYGDDDQDGVGSKIDNCGNHSNPDQADLDKDGIGDLCDPTPYGDDDEDGIGNTIDNCENHSNPDQADLDKDGIGDLCDPTPYGDDDEDGIGNTIDNCANQPNGDQTDQDDDGIGDVCDPMPYGDDDQDGIGNTIDNCVNHSNPDQADLDKDGIGDACEPVLTAENKSKKATDAAYDSRLIPLTGIDSMLLSCQSSSRIALDNDFYTLIQPTCHQIVTFSPINMDEIRVGMPLNFQMLAVAYLDIQPSLENASIGNEEGSSLIGFEIPAGMDAQQMKIYFTEGDGEGAEAVWKLKNTTIDGNVLITDALASGVYILVY